METISNNSIRVPVFLLDLLLDLIGVTNAAGDFLFELAVVANQFSRFATQGKNSSIAFAVENSRVSISGFEVRLVSADNPLFIRHFKTAILNTGVTVNDLVFQLQLEVIYLAAAPDDERVSFELFVFFVVSRASDGAVFYAPGLGIAVPAVQSFSIKQSFPVIRRSGSSGHAQCGQ